MWLKTVNQVHDHKTLNTLTSHTLQLEEGVVWYNDTCFVAVSIAHSSCQATTWLFAACSMEKQAASGRQRPMN